MITIAKALLCKSEMDEKFDKIHNLNKRKVSVNEQILIR